MTEPWLDLARWCADAALADPDHWNAAILATADADGSPSARVVLLKTCDDMGCEFFTNRNSRKARELDARPRAALCLHWPRLGRQLRVEGAVVPVSDARSDAYFATRDRASQIGAWASLQSSELDEQTNLTERVTMIEAATNGAPVHRPLFWGGYLLTPDRIEFWSNGAARLHERVDYVRTGSNWSRRKLYP